MDLHLLIFLALGGSDEVWGNAEEECNPFTFSLLDASIDYSVKKNNSSNNSKENFDYKFNLPPVKVKDKKQEVKKFSTY